MDRRKVLQEIPILVPQYEQQSFQIIMEAETPVSYIKELSSPARPHYKYISDDESKENITPAEFENIVKEEKTEMTSDVSDHLPDVTESSNVVSMQQENDSTTGVTAGAGTILTPRRDIDRAERLEECNTPLDFSKVTVGDLGISSESFTSKCAGKSPKCLRKYKRRSTIGVRGSPEMNFLIRQIALQRSNRNCEPEPLENPFTSPRKSLLRDKISAFRNAFQTVEETEGKLPFPGFSEEEEPNCGNGNRMKESIEPAQKRKRECDTALPGISSVHHKPCAPLLPSRPLENTQKGCHTSVPEKNSETDSSLASGLTDVPNISGFPITVSDELHWQEDEKVIDEYNLRGYDRNALSQSVAEVATTDKDKLHGPKNTRTEVQVNEVHTLPISTKCRKRKVMFINVLSPPMSVWDRECSDNHTSHTSSSPALRPVLKKTPRRDFIHFREGFVEDNSVFFSVQEATDNDENVHFKKTSDDSTKKKKRVTFGRELSPEVFDKTLPANTPLCRGSTPYRNRRAYSATPPAEPMAASQSPYLPLAQPDFDENDEEETLQPLSLCFEAESSSCDSPVSSSLPGHNEDMCTSEEVEDGSSSSVENVLLTSCESPQEIILSDTASSSDTDIVNETFIDPELEILPAGSRMTRSSNRRKSCDSEENPARNCTQIEETSKTSVIAKATSKRLRKPVFIKKSQIKPPRGKGKKSRGKSKKSVQKPFYGERENVSQKPLLSPIPELQECFPTPPAPTQCGVCLGKSQRKGLLKEVLLTSDGRTSSSKVQGFVFEDFNSDPVVREIKEDTEKLPTCVVEADQTPVILDGPGEEDLKVKDSDSPAKAESPAGPPVSDLVPQTDTVSGECLPSSAGIEIKDQPCKPAPATSDDISEDKDTIKAIPVMKQSYKRRSTAHEYVSQNTTEGGHSEIAEMSSRCVKQEDNADHSFQSPKTSIDAPKQETNALVPCASYNELSTEGRTCSPELPLASITDNVRKCRMSSRNHRRSTMFCASPEQRAPRENLSSVLPHFADNSASPTNDLCLPIDEVLHSTQREKKVRRSMRLRRDSGVIGLSWVQENMSSGEIGRQKSLASMVKHVESPTFVLENTVHSPNKENLVSQHVPSAARKNRRRTLCNTNLQESATICGIKRRRSTCYKNYDIAAAETSHSTAMPNT